MKKAIELLKTIDNNLIFGLLILFVFIIPLYPKFPLIDLEYTYIYVRAEDFFIVLINFIFIIQLLRRKVKLNTTFYKFFAVFLLVVTVSTLYGMFVSNTLQYHQIALLHAARRFEYMSIFFIASSTIINLKKFKTILLTLFISIFLVNIYGIGQRFLGFPAVSTMNPEFARGHILFLTPEARISSTFAGHYDLAAFIVLLTPLLWGMYFARLIPRFYIILNIILSYLILMYTASRSSIIGYLSTPLLLLFMRKFKYAAVVTVLSIVIFSFNGELSKRISQTFSVRQIFVNEKTGQVYVPQHITTENLPAGSAYIKLKTQNAQTDAETDAMIKQATLSGNLLNSTDTASLTANSKDVKQVSSVVADTSFSTRLQVEWPRAINALKTNPFLGTGPSSITESSDGDYFRWLGEFGLLGFCSFMLLLFVIMKYFYTKASLLPSNIKPLMYGMIFGIIGLMINALLIDVFEASKVAFIFWFITGTFTGYLSYESISSDLIPKKKGGQK